MSSSSLAALHISALSIYQVEMQWLRSPLEPLTNVVDRRPETKPAIIHTGSVLHFVAVRVANENTEFLSAKFRPNLKKLFR